MTDRHALSTLPVSPPEDSSSRAFESYHERDLSDTNLVDVWVCDACAGLDRERLVGETDAFSHWTRYHEDAGGAS